MQIDFESMENTVIPNFKNGEGTVEAKMFYDGNARIMLSRIRPGSSIGFHTHDINSEVIFIVSGIGKAVWNGEEQILKAGSCHYCPKGTSHTLINTGDDDLVMYAAVI